MGFRGDGNIYVADRVIFAQEGEIMVWRRSTDDYTCRILEKIGEAIKQLVEAKKIIAKGNYDLKDKWALLSLAGKVEECSECLLKEAVRRLV